MTKTNSEENSYCQTRAAFLWSRLFNIPFWTIINMLSFILYKDMQITTLQITIIVALKPISALFAAYWSVSIHQRQDRLISNLVWANILRFVPFLFFPWMGSAWLMILAFGVYMMLHRGCIPAWMEILKLNIKGTARERVFAYVNASDYLISAFMPLLIGWMLDDFHEAWRWIFPITALIGLSSTYFLFKIPPSMIPKISERMKSEFTISEHALKPWKDCWTLLKERPDFANFQKGFFLGGAGLMIMHAVLPIFFVDTLHLSYTEMAFAITLCKGIGYAVTSPIWVRVFHRLDIFYFCGLVTILIALFPFFLYGAEQHLLFFYFAYMMYGLMQAGSELAWHMSGPIFSQEGDSSVYSRTNVLTVGVRGCIAPFFGSFLFYIFNNSMIVLFCGSLVAILATERLFHYSRARKVAENQTS
jgi:Major Facilitator Superfamily